MTSVPHRQDTFRTRLAELLALATPVAGARLGVMAMALTNTIVVGRYSARELGYQALGWALPGVMVVTSQGLLSGIQVMTSRAIGEGRPELTGAAFRRGFVYALWIGVAVAAGLYALAPTILGWFGLDPALAAGAGRVARIQALSMPFYLAAIAAASFLEGLGRPGPGLIAMWGANAVNLALCLVLVGGRLGFPALGAMGAAWSTFGARVALMVSLLAYVALMPETRRLGVLRRPEPSLAHEVEQRRVGYGAGASLFMETAAFSGMNVIAGRIGGLAVAGWAIENNVAAIVFMIAMGLATAASVLVGRAYGARDRHQVVLAGCTGFIAAAVGAAVIATLVWLEARPIVGVYAVDPALIGLARGALVLACLFFVPDALQVVTAMALRARADVLVPTVTHTLSYALVMIPLGWVLGRTLGLGLNGLIWAVIVSSLMSSGLLLARFWMLARQEL